MEFKFKQFQNSNISKEKFYIDRSDASFDSKISRKIINEDEVKNLLNQKLIEN